MQKPSRQKKTKKPSYRFLVRLPIELSSRLRESARYYHRSINSDIVARVEHSFKGLPPDVVDAENTGMRLSEVENVLRNELSTEEDQLVRSFRRLSERQRRALLDLLTDISENYDNSEPV